MNIHKQVADLLVQRESRYGAHDEDQILDALEIDGISDLETLSESEVAEYLDLGYVEPDVEWYIARRRLGEQERFEARSRELWG